MYIACYALSVLFAYLAYKEGKGRKFVLFSVISILIPVLIAGLRDYSIGIDTMNYYEMERYWGMASEADSFGDYLAFYVPKGYGELFFAFVVGLVGQTGSFTLLLFVIHAWIMICVYIGAYRLREHVRPWLVLLLFYLAFFSHSLNVMRQYMALSLVFAFLADLPQKKYLRFVLAVDIATLFHASGLLSFGLLLVHWLLYGDFGKIRKEWNPTLRQRQIGTFAAVATMVVLFNPAVRLAIKAGLLHKKYLYYVKDIFAGYNLLVILFLAVELVALWVLYQNLREKNREFVFFATISVVYFILYQSTAFVMYGKRIAACCSLANLITLAMLPTGLGNEISVTLPKQLGGKTFTFFRFLGKLDEKQKELLGTVLVIGVVFVYWAYVYLLRNSSETMPYRFIFQ